MGFQNDRPSFKNRPKMQYKRQPDMTPSYPPAISPSQRPLVDAMVELVEVGGQVARLRQSKPDYDLPAVPANSGPATLESVTAQLTVQRERLAILQAR